MPGIYTVRVTNYFCGAHRLRGYQGDCVEMHGHNYQLTTEITAQQLDELGMVVDFAHARPIIDEIVKRLDHKFFNEVAPFDAINPTAENIAAWLYQQISKQLNSERVRVKRVVLQETPHEAVTYTEEV
jgi:6-pyruvoyltetrahydropterin/6-carboxytetrahydropterin synthase